MRAVLENGGADGIGLRAGSPDRAAWRLRPALAFARRHWRPLVLLVLSAVLAGVYAAARPYILFNDGDPLTYFRKAWWYLGQAGGMDVPSRGPGYPIWLILTGAAPFDTWWLLVASHIAMAVTAPLLFYGILAPVSRNAGFAAGLLFMAYGVPYQHMHWVMTEELFLFMELLSFLLIARHLCGGWALQPTLEEGATRWMRFRYAFLQWIRTPYAIAFALAYATMVKPAASPFFWLFVLVCVLFRVEPWKRYVGPVLLYVAIMAAWGTFDYFRSPVRFSPLGMPGGLTQRNFADVYYSGGFGAVTGWRPVLAAADSANPRPAQPIGELQPASIRPEDGPASQRLYEAVTRLVEAQRAGGRWNADNAETAYQLYGRYDSTDDLVRVIFARPNPTYFDLIMQAAASSGGDQLLLQVAREHANTGFLAYVKYLVRHPTMPLTGPPNSYVGYHFFSKFYRYNHFMKAGYYGARNLFVRSAGAPLVSASNGPGSAAFERSIRFFVSTYPQFIGIGAADLAELGGAEGLIRFVIQHPYSEKYSGAVMGWVFQWLGLLYGEERAGDLMAAAALETLRTQHAASSIVIGDFLAATVFAGDGAYGSMKDHFSLIDVVRNLRQVLDDVGEKEERLLKGAVQSGRPNNLPPSLSKHVGSLGDHRDFARDVNAAFAVQYGVFKLSKSFLFGLMLVFAIALVLASAGGALVAFLVVAFFVSAAAWDIAMIMPGSDPRHEDVYAFIPLLVAALGIASVGQLVRLTRANLGPWPSTVSASAGSHG